MSTDFLKSLDHKLLALSINKAKKLRKFSQSMEKEFRLIFWIHISKESLQFVDIWGIFLLKNHNNILDLMRAILKYIKSL